MKKVIMALLAASLILATVSCGDTGKTASPDSNRAQIPYFEVPEETNNEIPEYITIRGEHLDTTLTEFHFMRPAFDNLENDDIEPLKYMADLTSLNLSFKPLINDISPLSELIKLTKLDLVENQINDINPLAKLTNLTELWLSHNQIEDISPLAGLINLTSLSIHDNKISDVSALEGLTNLEILNLINNQISDVSALEGLTNLKSLALDGNSISDVSALMKLTNLTQLMIRENPITAEQASQLREALPNTTIFFD